MRIPLLIVIFSMQIFIFSCNKDTDSDEANRNYIVRGDTVILTEDSNIKSRIQLYTVENEQYRLELASVGTVRAIPNNYAEIAPSLCRAGIEILCTARTESRAGLSYF